MTSDRVGMIMLLGLAVVCLWRFVHNWRDERREAREAKRAKMAEFIASQTRRVTEEWPVPRATDYVVERVTESDEQLT